MDMNMNMNVVSKGMTLIDISTNLPVKLNQLIRPRYEHGSSFYVLGGTAPFYDGGTGLVYVKNEHGMKSEASPNTLGLAWKVLT